MRCNYENNKYLLGIISILMTISILFACIGVDEDEPNTTEEPSEQQQEDENNDNM